MACGLPGVIESVLDTIHKRSRGSTQGMNSFFAGKVFYGLHERAKGQQTTLQYGRYIERQHWNEEQLRDFSNGQLRQLVSLAFEKSSFYRARFEAAGIKPGDIRDAGDLAGLPLLSK